MINRLDGLDVNCSCEIPTLIVHNLDQPGHVAEVTSMLAHKSVNIANMSLYRDKRGGSAVMDSWRWISRFPKSRWNGWSILRAL